MKVIINSNKHNQDPYQEKSINHKLTSRKCEKKIAETDDMVYTEIIATLETSLQ